MQVRCNIFCGATLPGRSVISTVPAACAKKKWSRAMIDETHAPTHPLRRVLRWLVIAALTVGLARAFMLLAGS